MELEDRGSQKHPESLGLNVLEVIADAGVALMSSGAEVSRVEDTMERLARAYHLGQAEVMVLPTALFLHTSEGHTLLRRIRRRAVNLAVVSAINQLSRDVAREPVPAEVFAARLRLAKVRMRYPLWANMIFAAVAASAMSQLMGGRPADLWPAFITGGLTQLARQGLRETGISSGVGDLLAAVVAVLPALAAASVGIAHPGSVLVSGIMVLAPGLLMTTAVRDGIQGDILASAGRMLEALLSAGAIAAGASLPLYVYLAMGGRWP